MAVALSPLGRLAAWRRAIRLAVWRARTRAVLARHGCDLRLVAHGDIALDELPLVQPTRQWLSGVEPTRRGRLTIELGAHVHLGRVTTIEVLPSADSRLVLGEGTACGTGVRFVLFGGTIELGPASRVRDGAMLKSSGRLRTGRQTILQNQVMLHCARELVLEDRVTLAERVSVLDSDHLADGSDAYTQEQPLAVDPVRIGANAWIGANAVVLRGVELGANAVVAAGSVVRGGRYPRGWLVAGAPAEARRPLPAADLPVRRDRGG